MTDNVAERNFCYRVLYVPGAGQHRLKNIVEENFPDNSCKVFVPRMQRYRRGSKQLEEIPIFPGYVFLYTCLDMKEVHELLRGCQSEHDSAFLELSLRERQMEDPDFLYKDAGTGDYELSDVSDEEAEFLDLLRQGDGLLAISCGYEENKTYHVMSGPLKAYEDKIQAVDKHNRKAFLRFEICGRQVRAGFECRPKSYWFPKGGTAVATLSDGTEIDLEELKRKLTTKS